MDEQTLARYCSQKDRMAEEELYRRFTPREAARIQSFPDEFQFAGSETDAYRQIGNAVPPVLFWHIANKIANDMLIEE